MRIERSRGWRSGVLGVGLVLGSLLIALSRPAAAQEIDLELLEKDMSWGTGSLILIDQLEYAPGAEGRPVSLEAIGWYGGAYNRLWFRAEGEQLTAVRGGEGEAQLLYGRLVTPYWDAVAGVRLDGHWGEARASRALLAVGLIGMAPLRFEVSPMLFLSQDGDLSARLETEYQILVTQRLVATPEVELNVALQEVPEFGVGRGLNDYELGMRLRYEIRREFAPYVGYSWTRRVGGTANLARAAGAPVSIGAFVAGLRLWR